MFGFLCLRGRFWDDPPEYGLQKKWSTQGVSEKKSEQNVNRQKDKSHHQENEADMEEQTIRHCNRGKFPQH